MKFLICAAAGAALTLSACNRTEETPSAVEAPPADAAALDASAAAPSADGGTAANSMSGASRRGAGSGANGASTETMSPSNPMSADGAMDGPSPAVRDMAKEKAEETNLHPKTP